MSRVEGIGLGHLLFRREGEVADLAGLLHGQQAGGEAVRELLQDALRVLVGAELAHQLEAADGGFRVVRAVEGGGEARSQVPDAVFVGIVRETGRALGLFLPVPDQFLQGLIRGPFHQDRPLAAARGEERLRVGVPDRDGDAERGRQQDVRLAGETLAKRFQLLGSKGDGAFHLLHFAFSAGVQVGNQTRIQVGAGRIMFNEPGTGLFRARGGRLGNGLTHVAFEFT